MERYAPHAKDLASRDVVSRAITIEIREGRGVGAEKDHIQLNLQHLDPKVLKERLPGISESARIFAGVDVTREPIPVLPTVHYNMGGIPTNYHGGEGDRVDGEEQVVPGLMAVGGRRACRYGAISSARTRSSTWWCSVAPRQTLPRSVRPTRSMDLPTGAGEMAVARLDRYRHAAGSSLPPSSAEMQKTMQENCAVFRNDGRRGPRQDPRRVERQRGHPTSRCSLIGTAT
jgi:succinate dehydrogenase / fumarate reductase flavoprotein subunit